MTARDWTQIRGAFVMAAVLVVTLGAAQPSGAGGDGDDDSGLIAFTSTRAGGADIWVMKPDGSLPTRLTSDPASETFPSWSPDGTRIAFVRGSGLARELFVMRANGTDVRRLTNNNVADVQPDWSPSGKELAFVRFGPDGNRDIWSISSDGTDERQLTADPAPFDILPDWAPTGRRIAFESDRSGAVAVYTMRADGSRVQKLTPDALQGGAPAWSPNGKTIAFYDNFCDTCPLIGDVFAMDADGSDIRKLAELGNVVPIEDGPSWAPDGDALAVSGFDSTTFEVDVYVVDLEDGALTNLTASAGPGVLDFLADWSREEDD
jgi:Tol biopolymer transport system component